MNFVEPICDRKKIAQIKNQLRGKRRYRDLLRFVVGINMAIRISDLLKLRVDHFLNDQQRIRKGDNVGLGGSGVWSVQLNNVIGQPGSNGAFEAYSPETGVSSSVSIWFTASSASINSCRKTACTHRCHWGEPLAVQLSVEQMIVRWQPFENREFPGCNSTRHLNLAAYWAALFCQLPCAYGTWPHNTGHIGEKNL